MVIYKYHVNLRNNQLVLPTGSRPLSVQLQDGTPVMWFEVDVQEANYETRKFVAVNTGGNVPDHIVKFIGTVQWDEIVLHYYEVYK